MGTTSDPRHRGITVTIKYGKAYDDTWAVFHGLSDDVRHDISDFFGLAPEEAAGLTLSDLVVNATSAAHSVSTVARGLGGVVIASTSSETSPVAGARSADPWTDAATLTAQPATSTPPRPQPESENPLLALIHQAATVRALEMLWVENQDAFADPDVMAAWKARGRVLSTTA